MSHIPSVFWMRVVFCCVVSSSNGIRFNKFISMAHCLHICKIQSEIARVAIGQCARTLLCQCRQFFFTYFVAIVGKTVCMKNESYIGYISSIIQTLYSTELIQLPQRKKKRERERAEDKKYCRNIPKFMICCCSYCCFLEFLLCIVLNEATELYRIGNISFLT